MNNLVEEMKRQLANSLIRSASVSCSRWAENYVVLGKPKPGRLSFIWHPWEKEMMDCNGPWSGRKAAQMGYSNVALCRSIFTNDIKKNDVLYLLPKRSPDAADFSKAKFDGLLDLSPHLAQLYSNTRNIGHKQAGHVNFYIRGARSRAGLKAISAGLQVWDELDEMPKKQLALALERSSGYDAADTQLIKISTPTLPDFGIDAEIKTTDQSVFVFKCPFCSRWTDLPFPDCLKITADSLDDEAGLRQSYIFCPLCKHDLPHEEKPRLFSLDRGAHWQPTKKGFAARGFLINQYYSTVIEPWKIAESWVKGQVEASDLQEYWNSKGGIAFMPEGARVNDTDITECLGNHTMDITPPRGHLVTMGIDPGKVIHYWIDQWQVGQIGPDVNINARCRNLKHGHVDNFEELDEIMQAYQIVHAVIDWQPEERKSHEFCVRFAGHAHRCYFHKGVKSKSITKNDDSFLVGVGRTSWLELALTRFKKRTILLPRDTKNEAKLHIKNLVKKDEKDSDGNPTARYISIGSDHFGLCRMYSEIALPLAISAAESQDVSAFL